MRDIQLIRKQFEATIRHSQDFSFHLHTKGIIDKWYEAKKPYIDLFGGETQIKLASDVSLNLSEEALDSLFSRFIASISSAREEENLADCENPTLKKSFYQFLKENREGFFQNRVVKDYPALKVGKGTKLLKCFKFFVEDFSKCRWAQDMASRFIQGTKVCGNLYLSVDPLDFLTVSENDSSWRSCHSLDGDFRSGNLNYLLDDTSLIVYLASDKKKQLKCMPAGLLWNDKKWRMLIHTNNWKSIIYYNRQYPFTSPELLKTAYEGIEKLAFSVDKQFFCPPQHTSFKTIKIGGERDSDLEYNFILGLRERIYDTRDIIDFEESFGYCDLMYSRYYTPVFSIRDDKREGYSNCTWESDDLKKWDEAFHNVFDITIGKTCKCVRCGKGDISRPDSFLCDDCIVNEDADTDLFAECEWCGRRLYPGDQRFNYEGDIICEECNSACTTSGTPIVE